MMKYGNPFLEQENSIKEEVNVTEYIRKIKDLRKATEDF